MKRFFCRVCQRVKRVRRLPSGVLALTDGDNKITGYSEGTCDYHDRGRRTRAEVMGRVRRVVPQRLKKPVVSTPPKEKRKGK